MIIKKILVFFICSIVPYISKGQCLDSLKSVCLPDSINELNKQGFNYGERLNYKAIHTKEGNIIPFNESALTSLKYNSSMGKKAHYIKTK